LLRRDSVQSKNSNNLNFLPINFLDLFQGYYYDGTLPAGREVEASYSVSAQAASIKKQMFY